MATEEQKKNCPAWVHLVGGGVGGLLGALVTSPLEVMKTRLQAARHNASLRSEFMFGLGTLSGVRKMWTQEGFFGLYRGLGAHFLGVVPSRGIHFWVYGNTKNYLEKHFPHTTWVPALASGLAGATVVTVLQPIWFVKTILQLQTVHASETLHTGFWDVVRKTIHTEGYRGLYKGLSASYLGLIETMLQFTLYEKMKVTLLDSKRERPDTHISISSGETIFISALSKFIASFATYPHEVIRTRLREQKGPLKYKNAIQGLILLAREEGRQGLYTGMGSHLMRVAPNAAITLFTYESFLSIISKHYTHDQ